MHARLAPAVCCRDGPAGPGRGRPGRRLCAARPGRAPRGRPWRRVCAARPRRARGRPRARRRRRRLWGRWGSGRWIWGWRRPGRWRRRLRGAPAGVLAVLPHVPHAHPARVAAQRVPRVCGPGSRTRALPEPQPNASPCAWAAARLHAHGACMRSCPPGTRRGSACMQRTHGMPSSRFLLAWPLPSLRAPTCYQCPCFWHPLLLIPPPLRRRRPSLPPPRRPRPTRRRPARPRPR